MKDSGSTRLALRRLAAGLALLALSLSSVRGEDMFISIQCSPSTVAMHAVRSGNWLTVHTDLAYGVVDPASVELLAPEGGLDAATTFADNCGNLVAKFRMSALKPLLERGTTQLTLAGCTRNGIEFAGTDTVRVVSR